MAALSHHTHASEASDLNVIRYGGDRGSASIHHDVNVKLPMSPRAPSPLTPPATGDAKVAHGSSAGQGASLPIAARQSVSPCSRQRFPIRDSPRNPFLLGGPADAGLFGPRRWNAQQRMASLPLRERGKMTYVFRGQRVTYADPYASSDSEEDEGGSTAMQGRERTMDRLRPQVLFPQQSVTSASTSSSSKKRAHTENDRQTSADWRPTTPDSSKAGHSVQTKRRRYDQISTDNAVLLSRLARAGWESEEEDAIMQQQEENEEDEIDIAVLAPQTRQQHWQDSESEEDEAEVNPFLSTAQPHEHR